MMVTCFVPSEAKPKVSLLFKIRFARFIRQTNFRENGLSNSTSSEVWGNGFYCHIRENKGHKIDWDKALFLDYEKNWKRRKINQAIYINAINPTNTMNKKGILNLEKGYELDAVWSELNFNEVHRLGIARKMA